MARYEDMDEPPPLRITYAGATSRPDQVDLVLCASDVWKFGRSSRCNLQLSVTDRGVSREAGKVHFDGRWMLTNTSATRACYILRTERSRQTVAPGESVVLAGPVSVAVSGDEYTYRFDVHLADQTNASNDPASSSEAATFVPVLSDLEQWAVGAMAWGYMQIGARHNPNPLTYAEAASLLDLPSATVRKRVENLRLRLAHVGIPDVTSSDARRALVEFCLTHQLIAQTTLDSIRLIRR